MHVFSFSYTMFIIIHEWSVAPGNPVQLINCIPCIISALPVQHGDVSCVGYFAYFTIFSINFRHVGWQKPVVSIVHLRMKILENGCIQFSKFLRKSQLSVIVRTSGVLFHQPTC